MTELARRIPTKPSVWLLGVAGLAWWWTVDRMRGMNASPSADLGTVGWFAISWTLMMAAMMLPSFAPTLSAYQSQVSRAARRALMFVTGYLLAWLLAGVLAYGLVRLGTRLFGSELRWANGGRWLSATLVCLAAAYELSPQKRTFLDRCHGVPRSPGAERAALLGGAISGTWCIGCTGMLVVALFALGVMNLTWMVMITALIVLQKIGPWLTTSRIATATLLVLLAAGILLAPQHVPGLSVPSPMHTMGGMGANS